MRPAPQPLMTSLERVDLDAPSGKRPALLPWLVALFVGSLALGLFFLIRPAIGYSAYYRPGATRTSFEYNHPILLLFIPYALALLAWRRGARAPLWLLLAGAMVLHILVLFAPLPQSQDFYQYLFYGRMQAAHGANPYLLQPVLFNTDPWYGWIRWRDQTSVYGPAWTLLSFGVAKLSGGSLARAFVDMKLAVLAMDAGVMALIVAAARHRPDPDGTAGWGILAYAWNPLVLITVPLGGLADIGVAVALLGALVARRRGRTWLATALLALAALVKVYAVVGLLLHLALLLRERRRAGASLPAAARTVAAHAGVTAAIATAAYAPYWAGLQTFHGVLSIADRTNRSLTGTVQRLLGLVLRALGLATPDRTAGTVVRWLAGAVLVLAIAWAIGKVRSERGLWQGTVFVLIAYILLTPWSHYWYLVAPLALVAAQPGERLTAPVLTLSGTALVTVWLSPSVWYQALESVFRYGPGIVVGAVRRPKRRARGAGVRPERGPAPELGREPGHGQEPGVSQEPKQGREPVIPEPVMGSKPAPEPVAP